MNIINYSPLATLQRAAAQHPTRPNLIAADSGRTWSVLESLQTVFRLVKSLSPSSQAPLSTAPAPAAGPRWVVVGQNSAWHFLLHAAAAQLGAVTVPLSPRLPQERLALLFADCQPQWVFSDGQVDLTGLVSAPPRVAGGGREEGDGEHPTKPWHLSFAQLEERLQTVAVPTSEQVSSEQWPALNRQEELAAIVYTSGSTGLPRGVRLTHRSLWWGSQNFRSGFEYNPGLDTVGLCAPISHIGGFNGTSLDTFSHGGTLVIFPKFDPPAILRACREYRIAQMFLVPAMAHSLLDAARGSEESLASLRNPLIGGDVMDEALYERFRQAGLRPIHVWGMTETSASGLMRSPEAPCPPHSLGVPFPYNEARLVDASGQVVHGPGSGQLQVRGPSIAPGYWVGAAQDRADGDLAAGQIGPWLETGDLASRDEQGFYYFQGRQAHIIRTGGEQASPLAIERALRAQPEVATALAVGLPDPKWGQVVGVLLVGRHGNLDAATTAELFARVAPDLAPWEKPRRGVWVAALPLSVNGKPDREQARQILSAGSGSGQG